MAQFEVKQSIEGKVFSETINADRVEVTPHGFYHFLNEKRETVAFANGGVVLTIVKKETNE